MIYFLTKRRDHDPIIYKSGKITVLDNLDKLVEIMLNNVLGFDVEANGKRYYQTELLLFQLGNKENQVVIDMTEPDYLKGWRQIVVDTFNTWIRPTHIFIGHNLKYDSNVCTPYGFKLPDFFDTLLAEQRINLGSGLFNNLKDTYERHLKKFFPEDKDIRKDFVYMNRNSKLLLKHIMYAAGDVGDIIEIASKQKEILSGTRQAWFVRNVEFPLVKLLSEMELEGLDMDKPTWTTIIANKKKRRFECELEMDQIISTLGKGNVYLTGGKFSTKRKKQISIQPDMFGGDDIVLENKNTHNVNYSSSQIVIDIIDKMGLPKPTFITAREEKESLSEEAVQTYLMNYPDTPIKSFLEKLLEYKGLQKFVSSYGDKFIKATIYKNGKYEIGFVNPVTNRVHTVFKQCFTDTGRLASGSKEEGLFNIQNLPAEKEIRQAFRLSAADIAAGYYFSTIDLSGAELVIMAALAGDLHLYELGAIKDDIHSPVATKCWRAVHAYRVSKGLPDFTIKDSKGKTYTLTEDFLVNKETNKQLRTDFKPMIFGVFYGLMAKKGSETLKIPKDEAQVIIDIITREFPKTIAMLEAAVRHAFRYGYVVFNTRSYNRRNFKPIQDILKTIDTSKYDDSTIIEYVKSKLDFMTVVEITGEARNCRIQGTQADMIKESLVAIRRHPEYEKCKAKLLLTVHDENGAKHLGTEFGKIMESEMTRVANEYLKLYSDTIRMKAEGHTIHSWTK
jgi:DNA polymerase-1